MNKFLKFLLSILCALNMSLFAQEMDEYAIPNELLIQLSKPIEKADLELPKNTNIKSILSKTMQIYLLENSSDFSQKDLSLLRAHRNVLKIQYNHRVQSRSIVPNDPFFNLQWNMNNDSTSGGVIGADIQALDAWMLNNQIKTVNGDTIVVAIIEEPMDLHHEDINYFINYNEIDSNGIDDDGNGYIDDYRGWNAFDNIGIANNTFFNHGIHVAGIATAKRDNGIGVTGVASGFKMLPIDGSSEDEAVVVRAYDYVINMRRLYDATAGAKGAYIVATNASFGVGQFGAQSANYPIWCGIYDTLGKVGILNIAAAPNSNVNVDIVGDVPSACPSDYLISVTNTNKNDTKNNGAAYGKTTIDIGAPGTAIYSCYPNNTYGNLTGTSMSAPHVTGAVAGMYAVACSELINNYTSYPDSFAKVFKNYLLRGAERLNSMNGKVSSDGRLNLYRTYSMVSSYNCNACNFSTSDSITPITCFATNTGKICITTAPNIQSNWSTGDTTAEITTLSSGEYTVTIQDGTNCTQTKQFFLDEPQPINIIAIDIIPINGSNPGNLIVVATAGNDQLMYAMDNGPYQTTSAFSSQVAGPHTLSVKNQYGCIIDTVVVLGNNTGIEGLEKNEFFIQVYPQPAKDEVRILIDGMDTKKTEILFYDIHGKIVLRQLRSNEKEFSINVHQLQNGLYTIRINTQENQSVLKKLLIAK